MAVCFFCTRADDRQVLRSDTDRDSAVIEDETISHSIISSFIDIARFQYERVKATLCKKWHGLSDSTGYRPASSSKCYDLFVIRYHCKQLSIRLCHHRKMCISLLNRGFTKYADNTYAATSSYLLDLPYSEDYTEIETIPLPISIPFLNEY